LIFCSRFIDIYRTHLIHDLFLVSPTMPLPLFIIALRSNQPNPTQFQPQHQNPIHPTNTQEVRFGGLTLRARVAYEGRAPKTDADDDIESPPSFDFWIEYTLLVNDDAASAAATMVTNPEGASYFPSSPPIHAAAAASSSSALSSSTALLPSTASSASNSFASSTAADESSSASLWFARTAAALPMFEVNNNNARALASVQNESIQYAN
jgi:hypothetical protein